MNFDNLFQSGFALMMVGAVMVYLRAVPLMIWDAFQRRFTVRVEINSIDDAFHWVERWIDAQPYMRKCTRLTASTSSKNLVAGGIFGSYGVPAGVPDGDEPGRGSRRPQVYFSPSPGIHFFKHAGRFILLRRIREQQQGGNSGGGRGGDGPMIRERFVIQMMGSDDSAARDLIHQARDFAIPEHERAVQVRTKDWEGWGVSSRLPPRFIDSVILKGNQAVEILEGLRWFRDNPEWYGARGVPWRRGVLLEGPPGGGKSSLVHAIASELQMDVYVLALNGEYNDQTLNRSMGMVGPNSILLIEDVDCAFHGRQAQSDTGQAGRASFSGLLNVLDGLSAGVGRIVFMTTNHPEKLDPAVMRPGRVDLKVHVGWAEPDQIKRLFLRFFPGKEQLALECAEGVGRREGLAMASVQEVFLQAKDDPHEAIRLAREAWAAKDARSEDGERQEAAGAH